MQQARLERCIEKVDNAKILIDTDNLKCIFLEEALYDK